jgi:hypothetical protein
MCSRDKAHAASQRDKIAEAPCMEKLAMSSHRGWYRN